MTGPDKFSRESLGCEEVRRKCRGFHRGQISEPEREQVLVHMEECPACAEMTLSVRELRRAVQALPVRTPPADLNLRLRVVASREAARQRAAGSWWKLAGACASDWRLWANNLMRPLAIPTAGGFVSALLLFGILAPNFQVPGNVVSANDDVPTGLYTEASVKRFMPVGFEGDDVVVELTIDDQGRMVDYSLPELQQRTSRAMRKSLENRLLLMEFNPATSFGQPTAGKVRVYFRSSRIDVKG
jgi:hypothetical protein